MAQKIKEILLASSNSNKAREIKAMLGDGWQVKTLVDYPDFIMPPEDGHTFEANAAIKARAGIAASGLITLADDSGLEVDFLNGAPGVYSARFAGDGRDDKANNQKVLSLLAGAPEQKRTARFVCVMAVAAPDGRLKCCYGSVEGFILTEERGNGGFGYDPLFFLPQLGMSMAELEPAVKNSISHRARALAKAKIVLEAMF